MTVRSFAALSLLCLAGARAEAQSPGKGPLQVRDVLSIRGFADRVGGFEIGAGAFQM